MSYGWEFASLNSGARQFLRTKISQGSAVEMWCNIQSLLCQKFIAKSAFERILKISHCLAKLEEKVKWHLFSRHGVYLK